MSYYVRFVLLLSALVAVIFILAQISTPTSFGKFGFYRGDNVQEWMEVPVKHVGSNQCVDCHDQVYNRWSLSKHSGVSCESCHGAAGEHIKTNASLGLIVASDRLCRLCHSASISRPASFPQIDFDEHWSNITMNKVYTLKDVPGVFNYTCSTCHDPKGVGLAVPQIPHQTEGRSDCTLCHGSEGVKPFPEDHVLRPNDVCLACHRMGEVLQIPKIPHTLEGRANCTLCHGSSGIKPFPEDHAGRPDEVCLQCHVGG